LTLDNNDASEKNETNLNKYKKVRGFGDVVVKLDGRKYLGTIDIDWTERQSSVQIYSGIGSTFASIKADSTEGYLQLNKETQIYKLNAIMADFPLKWGGCITFGEFLDCIAGYIPEKMFLSSNQRDSIFHVTIGLAPWNVAEFQCEAVMKKNKLFEVRVRNRMVSESGIVIFSSFKNGYAQTILIKDNDKNFISIRYEKTKNI
jgi:hypothetical protein